MKPTLSDIAGVLKADTKKSDRHFYGVVKSVNKDSNNKVKSYNVALAGENDTVTCRKLAGAKVGDTVMVTLMQNGTAVVTGTIGGDTDAADAVETAESVQARADAGEFDGRDGQDGQDGADGADAPTIIKAEDQFVLHTSNSNPPSDSANWQTTLPTYVSGQYYWKRTATYLSDNSTLYSDPVLDTASQLAAEADELANTASTAATTAQSIADAANTAATTANTNATTALNKATATEQHFWYDSSGAHVSETAGSVASGASQTISSAGTVMMRNGKLITSWTGSSASDAALNFYDCSNSSAQTSDLMATFNRAGVGLYVNNKQMMSLTGSGLTFYQSNGSTPMASYSSTGATLYGGGTTNYATATSSGFNVVQNGVNVASFGATGRVGSESSYNTLISSDGIQFRSGTTAFGAVGPFNGTYTWPSNTSGLSIGGRHVYIEVGTSRGASSVYHFGPSNFEIPCATTVGTGALTVTSGNVTTHNGRFLSQYTYDNPSSSVTTPTLYINANGTIMKVSSSSKRYKCDIEDADRSIFDPHKLYDIPFRQFRYKKGYFGESASDDAYKTLRQGFIAEEVGEAYPSAIVIEDGEVETWSDRELIPPMLALIQEQHAEIEELKRRLS